MREDVVNNLVEEQEKLKSIVLDHYHCTFFLPIVQDIDNRFDLEPKANRAHTYGISNEVRDQHAQAYHFFTPHIRNILFDTGKESPQLEPMKEWLLTEEDIREWELNLFPSKLGESEPLENKEVKLSIPKKWPKYNFPIEFNKQKQTAVFQSVKLYRYFNGNYLLSFRVAPKVLRDLKAIEDKEISLFTDGAHQYFSEFEADPNYHDYSSLNLESWLRFSRLARQLFPSFTEQGPEQKIAPLSFFKGDGSNAPVIAFDKNITPDFPEHIGEQLSPVVTAILSEFFDDDEDKQKKLDDWVKHYFKLYDDRIFTSVAYGLAGKKHDEGTLNIINTLAATTDRVADVFTEFYNMPYTPEAMTSYLKGTTFDFWKALGSTYTYTNVTNAYVSNGWFFRSVIAPTHIPYLYDRMMVQALFYQTSLRYYDDAITKKTTQLTCKGSGQAKDGMTELLGEFIRFTNQYWFKEVTNQMQGKEIFKLQLKGLSLDEHFSQLQDEINRTNDYLQVKFEQQQGALESEKNTKFTKLGLLIAVIALVPILNDVFKPEASLWSSIACWVQSFYLEQEVCNVDNITNLSRIGVAGVIASVTVILGYLAYKKRS